MTKTEFLCGKAEDIIPGMMTGERSAEVIAIADPPRSGLRETISVAGDSHCKLSCHCRSKGSSKHTAVQENQQACLCLMQS